MAEREVAENGLDPSKCVSMSILMNGEPKKNKITTGQLFTISDGPITLLGPSDVSGTRIKAQ